MNPALATGAWRARLREWTGGPVGAAAGAVAYGAWALYVNWPAGASSAARSALAHALLSAVLTSSSTATMRRLFSVGRGPRARRLLAIGGGLAFTYAVLLGVHCSVGTMRVLATLAPGAFGNVAFCVGYVALLDRTSGRP